jgi:pyridoxamine 5'-phosphate oxidase
MSYQKARKDYILHELWEKDCPASPEDLLDKWLKEAHSDNEDANAMTLSTVNSQLEPSNRIVLLRGLSSDGIVFYTNYDSDKGQEMAANSNVALNFFWSWMERQVRIKGRVERLPESQSDAYFNSRPRESQVGAWASAQSSSIANRSELDETVQLLEAKYEGIAIPRPKFWGGYLVQVNYFEFWQGRANRLHDRIAYTKNEMGWSINRLSP